MSLYERAQRMTSNTFAADPEIALLAIRTAYEFGDITIDEFEERLDDFYGIDREISDWRWAAAGLPGRYA